MRIIIDPSLIWFNHENNMEEYFEYLKSVTDFIDKYLDMTLLTSTEIISLLRKLNKDPFSSYRETQQQKTKIIRNLMHHIDTDDIVTLLDETIVLPKLATSESKEANKTFQKLLNYSVKNSIECLLFLALNNHTCNDTVPCNIKLVRHVYMETDSHLAELFSTGNYINKENFLQATEKKPLPNKDLCMGYTTIRNTLIQDGKGGIPLFLKLGREVIYRNGYIKDDYLTKINNSAIREIFRKDVKNSWYLSTDVEHGAIEVCDEIGRHVDEYNYEGVAQCKRDKSGKHNIKLKK